MNRSQELMMIGKLIRGNGSMPASQARLPVGSSPRSFLTSAIMVFASLMATYTQAEPSPATLRRQTVDLYWSLQNKAQGHAVKHGYWLGVLSELEPIEKTAALIRAVHQEKNSERARSYLMVLISAMTPENVSQHPQEAMQAKDFLRETLRDSHDEAMVSALIINYPETFIDKRTYYLMRKRLGTLSARTVQTIVANSSFWYQWLALEAHEPGGSPAWSEQLFDAANDFAHEDCIANPTADASDICRAFKLGLASRMKKIHPFKRPDALKNESVESLSLQGVAPFLQQLNAQKNMMLKARKDAQQPPAIAGLPPIHQSSWASYQDKANSVFVRSAALDAMENLKSIPFSTLIQAIRTEDNDELKSQLLYELVKKAKADTIPRPVWNDIKLISESALQDSLDARVVTNGLLLSELVLSDQAFLLAMNQLVARRAHFHQKNDLIMINRALFMALFDLIMRSDVAIQPDIDTVVASLNSDELMESFAVYIDELPDHQRAGLRRTLHRYLLQATAAFFHANGFARDHVRATVWSSAFFKTRPPHQTAAQALSAFLSRVDDVFVASLLIVVNQPIQLTPAVKNNLLATMTNPPTPAKAHDTMEDVMIAEARFLLTH